MSDKPIIFSAPMVRALLEGRKTQTRRIIKPQPHERAKGCYRRPNGSWVWVDAYRENNGTGFFGNRLDDTNFRLPYAPGGRLYLREAHAIVPSSAYRMSRGVVQAIDPADRDLACVYREGWERSAPKWRPSIHMPRWASRLTLTVTDVRVQRLQDISEADAMAEGIERLTNSKGPNHFTREIVGKWSGSFNAPTAQEVFADLWNSLHGPEAWDANPWVAAYSFTVQQGNIDMLAERAAQ